MNYTIYLTDKCNMNCKYCFEKNMHKSNEINQEDIEKILNYESQTNSKTSIITFFGGEPLIKKDLIYKTVNYAKKLNKEKFIFNIVTNATLLDDEIIDFINKNKFISISISIDGLEKTQKLNRIAKNESNYYQNLKMNLKKLLKNNSSKMVAVPVISKNNLNYISENLQGILNLGFKNINFQFDLKSNWTDQDLEIIRKQFDIVSKLYMEHMRNENEFSILAIDEKIRSYIDDRINCNDNCSVGLKGANIGTDGNIYPCMQFMYDDRYIIGNCENGIDKTNQEKVHNDLKGELAECKECSLNKRCNHTCSCINYSYTKNPKQTSPFTCEIERMLIEISDNIAEILYNEECKVFIQKFYNRNYKKIENQINKKGNDYYGT